MSRKTMVGIDWAYKPNWWKRLLVYFGIKKRDWDYSCMIIAKKEKDGTICIKEVRFYD